MSLSAESRLVDNICWNYFLKDDGTVGITGFSSEDDIRDLIIPSIIGNYTVTSIEASAFENCNNLTTIQIPNTVKSIGQYAFWGCQNLTSINIPNGISKIDTGSFADCINLSSITIPSSVTNIGASAFSGCMALTSIIIPEGVNSLGKNSFRGCQNLIQISLPSSIKSIYSNTFQNTQWLNNQPNGMVYLGDIALIWKGRVENWTSLTIKDGTSVVAHDAFEDLGMWLQSVSIPQSVRFFYGATSSNINLESLYITDLAAWCNTESTFDREHRMFLNGNLLEDVSIPQGVTEIKPLSFCRVYDLKSLNIPSSVKIICDGAFYNCRNLKTISGGDGLFYVGHEAFDQTQWLDLEESDETENVAYIGRIAYRGQRGAEIVKLRGNTIGIAPVAFKENSHLLAINIPNGVEYIGDFAFWGCSSLSSISIPGSVSFIDENAFSYCSSLHSVSLDEGVKEVRDFAFAYCTNLTSLHLANTITFIGEGAFSRCLSLESVEIPNSLTALDGFGSCPNLKTINIPNNITSIKAGALSGCGFTNITIPNSVTRIDTGAFQGCEELTSVSLPQLITHIGVEAFADCYSLKEIEIPNSVKSIGWGCFTRCSGLISVVFGNNVSEICQYGFSECEKLSTISLPNSLEVIGSQAFYGCSNLNMIKIGKGIKDIGYMAFANVHNPKSLTRAMDDGLHVYCEAEGIPSTAPNAFDNTPVEMATLHVLDELVDSYKLVLPWNKFGTIIGLTATNININTLGSEGIQIYDLQGKHINNPRKGVNILLQKNRKVKKNIMK